MKEHLHYLQTQDIITAFISNREFLGRKKNTIQWYHQQLSRFAKRYDTLPLDPAKIESFLANIGKTPATKNAYYRTLKALYRFASRRYLFDDPFNDIMAPRLPKMLMPTLEPQQMYRLLSSVHDRTERAIITLFLDTGARSSEITSLRWNHIFHNAILVDGKVGERLIPISEETRQLLLSLPRHISNSPYVFNREDGQPMSRFTIYRIVRRLMEQIGVAGSKLGPHRLRHSFGKDYLVNGGDTRSLQQIMGHANITTTECYASLNMTDIVDKHHRFTPLRAAHASAQISYLDNDEEILSEVETMLKEARDSGIT